MDRRLKRALFYVWAKNRPLPRRRKPHGLPAPLVVSLTSHAPRFPALAATLRSLLAQSVAADHSILWVGRKERSTLPENVLALQEKGLTIRATEDVGPYTKIVPSLASFPEAFIATADDDRYYEPSWLSKLVTGYRGDLREVICRRAHKIVLDENGRPLSYHLWEPETRDRDPSSLIFPTGMGGVLYPPGCFHEDVLRSDIFTELAPTADDVWLYWMARLKNCQFRVSGKRSRITYWPKTQQVALWLKNRLSEGGNDDQIKRLGARYGYPFG